MGTAFKPFVLAPWLNKNRVLHTASETSFAKTAIHFNSNMAPTHNKCYLETLYKKFISIQSYINYKIDHQTVQ